MQNIHIFCDGGFANRTNTLIAGLYLSKNASLNPIIYWPSNNWCRAEFSDLFDNTFQIKNQELPTLKNNVGGMMMMLQDDIASNVLEVEFNSAYRHESFDEFLKEVQTSKSDVFYYPALIPKWIPEEGVNKELSGLSIKTTILQEARQFIEQRIGRPFYGVHLRRTDLNVGLTDHELRHLIKHYPDKFFFICSDSNEVEKEFSVYENAFSRTKKSNVDKLIQNSGWNDLTRDTANRMYAGNIERGAQAVIEGVIDLLILSQSTVVGNSGSTFQNMARRMGQCLKISSILKPDYLEFHESKTVISLMKNKQLSLGDLRSVCDNYKKHSSDEAEISLLREALNHFSGMELCIVLYNLSVSLTNKRNFIEASIMLEKALAISPDFAQAKELHAVLKNMGN